MAATRGRGLRSKGLFGRWAVDGSGSTLVLTQLVNLLVQLRPIVPAAASPCAGGGTVASSTNPSAGTSLATAITPLAYMTLQTDSGEERYGTQHIAFGSTFIEARVTRWGSLRRSLSDWFGGFDVGTFQVELADTDRRLRGLADSGTLLKKRVDVYVSDAATIRSSGTARRVFSGVVITHRPLSGLRYQLTCEDRLGSILNQYFSGRKTAPSRVFTVEDFPNLANPNDADSPSPGNPTLIGKPVPVCYGNLSDVHLGSDRIGVVPAHFVGRRLVDGFDWDEYVVCQGAVTNISEWFQYPGIGPLIRHLKEPESEGVSVLIPGHAGWTAAVGPDKFRDFNGRRYTVIYARGPSSWLATDGRIPITLNLCGYETVGDGTGSMIDSLALQVQHFLTNFVFSEYEDGNWNAIPTVNSYSVLKSGTFSTVKTVSEARVSGGHKGAWMLAHDGSAPNLRDVLADLCRSGDFDLGQNWDGQIIASMVNASSSSVADWTDLINVLQDGLDLERRFDLSATAVRYRYARRYIQPITNPTPAETDLLPGANRIPDPDWILSDEVTDAGAEAALGEDKPYDVTYGAVRDVVTADDVSAEWLARSAQHNEGPLMGQVRTHLEATDVDLGDNVDVTHFGGVGASGYTDKRLRVREQDLDLNQMTVTSTVQDVSV